MDLELTNVINISVAQSGTGVGNYNTSNLALFTHEPYANTFGTLGYGLYLSPTQVGVDFGTASQTYKMAVQVFSQQPNILANSGYLCVIPFVLDAQTVTFSATPASGSFALNYGGHTSALINYNDTASMIQTKIQAVQGLGSATVSGAIPAGLSVTFGGVYGVPSLMTVSSDTLQTSGSSAVTVTVTQATTGETIDAAIARTKDLVQYFGAMSTVIVPQADMLNAAAVVQALNKIAFFVSRNQADVAVGGMIDLLRSGSLTQSRGLFYGASNDSDALCFMASYAGRGLSVNFNGSLTTITMHLKQLPGVQPDPSMTQTLLALCQAAGADVYVSLQGVPSVLCSGANDFFDNQYNLQWFAGALQVAGFNLLAQTSTKIAQTEGGMDQLKGAYRQICEQARTNRFVSAGAWTSPNTFGNQADLLANISQRGYYIYSLPVSQQNAATRATRAAPLIQIAIKYAGAIHSSSVIVNVNK